MDFEQEKYKRLYNYTPEQLKYKYYDVVLIRNCKKDRFTIKACCEEHKNNIIASFNPDKIIRTIKLNTI
jgi:hypothetical protein